MEHQHQDGSGIGPWSTWLSGTRSWLWGKPKLQQVALQMLRPLPMPLLMHMPLPPQQPDVAATSHERLGFLLAAVDVLGDTWDVAVFNASLQHWE